MLVTQHGGLAMTLPTLLLILALVCFVAEGLRGNFARSPQSPPSRVYVGWGWIGLALCVVSVLVERF